MVKSFLTFLLSLPSFYFFIISSCKIFLIWGVNKILFKKPIKIVIKRISLVFWIILLIQGPFFSQIDTIEVFSSAMNKSF